MRCVRGHACICPGFITIVRRGMSEVPTTGKFPVPVTGLTTGVLPVDSPMGEGVLINGSVIDILSQEERGDVLTPGEVS